MDNPEEVLKRLAKSKFRSSFHLSKDMTDYINGRSSETIKQHAYDFINQRLKPALIPNDGRQTPMKNHPVFIAQHATATCCRGCLEKWHKIPKGRALTDQEVDQIVFLIMAWISQELKID